MKKFQSDNNFIENHSDSEKNSISSNQKDSSSEDGNYEDPLFENKPRLILPKINKRKRIINDLDDIYD